jgi:hypothetical protein
MCGIVLLTVEGERRSEAEVTEDLHCKKSKYEYHMYQWSRPASKYI